MKPMRRASTACAARWGPQISSRWASAPLSAPESLFSLEQPQPCTRALRSLSHSPWIVISFTLVGLSCVFAGLCYAEFASMIPVAASAYTYGYATLGEIFAWIIGWDLILVTVALAPATFAAAWG